MTQVYRPDQPFPTEAELCARYDASRPVLREAVKMLTAKGLLLARKRAGTVVQPEANWNLLDPDVLNWMLQRAFSIDLLIDFTEIRIAPEPDRPHNRLNDAKRDAAGRIWFGSKDDRDESASGALYTLEPDGRVVRHDDGYRVTNGPAFSPAGDRLYHTDSGRGCVYCYPLRDDGTLGPRRSFITFPPEWGVPDGMTTDRDGCLWIAHWGGGCLSRFDPDGRRMQSIALPASNITSCAFAGDALDRLFVTSAAAGTTDEPHAGALFEVEVDTPGLPVH